MDKILSKQRRWQLKKRAEGRCEKCGKPRARGYVHCKTCVIKNRLRQRAKMGCNPRKPLGRGRPTRKSDF